MKRTLLLIAALSITGAQSQEISDAIRYSTDNLNGTARFRAMSGAFGALGGDFSSLSVNPAGSAVFINNQAGFTLSSYNKKNESNYFGTKESDKESAFDLNQAAAVFVFNNSNPDSDWRKLSIGVAYENTNDFDNSVFSAGMNPNNSVANYFLSYANQGGGIPLADLQDFYYEELSYGAGQAFLGYQSYLIDPAESGSGYVSNVPAGGNFYQENSLISTGYNGKLSFNAATQYKDKIYFGLNLNSHFTDYRKSTSFYEQNSNDATTGIQRLRFNNDLYTYGSGFSFQLGAIAKVTREFRFGLAYESPTWYRLNDELSQNISTVRVENGASLNEYVDPGVTIVYDVYKLQTPGKWTGSLAYVFGTTSLISVDYSIKDYSNTEFRPSEDLYFQAINSQMSDLLDTAGELRIGAEHRIKQFSLRAGYRMVESPYKDGRVVGDLTGYSGGIGYNFGSTRLDLSYSYAKQDFEQSIFSQGFVDAPEIKSVNNNVSLSLVFEL
ncbi:MAG: outer membrane protein transport protein [Flavobacterium sp.]|nr:outer membrane protein transport protein [Flavobacterium sp.]